MFWATQRGGSPTAEQGVRARDLLWGNPGFVEAELCRGRPCPPKRPVAGAFFTPTRLQQNGTQQIARCRLGSAQPHRVRRKMGSPQATCLRMVKKGHTLSSPNTWCMRSRIPEATARKTPRAVTSGPHQVSQHQPGSTLAVIAPGEDYDSGSSLHGVAPRCFRHTGSCVPSPVSLACIRPNSRFFDYNAGSSLVCLFSSFLRHSNRGLAPKSSTRSSLRRLWLPLSLISHLPVWPSSTPFPWPPPSSVIDFWRAGPLGLRTPGAAARVC